MIRKNQKWINVLNILSDAFLIFASYFAAWLCRFELLDGAIHTIGGSSDLMVAVVYSFAVVVIYYIAQMYGSYRFKQPGDEALFLAVINAAAVLCLMAILYLFHVADFSRLMLLLLWAISSTLVIVKRYAVRKMLHHYRMLGYNQKHVVIVGNGHFAKQYIDDVQQNPQFGITVDGYFSRVKKPNLGPCLGAYESLEEYLGDNTVDDVIIALEPHEVVLMNGILAAADKQGSRVSIIPFYNDYFPTHPTIEAMGKTKLINMRATPLDNMGAALLKRTMDVVGSMVLLVLLSPLMLLVAIGVKLSSPGPVLFKQDRIGKDKKPFKMLKFRSMRTDVDHNGWSTQADPRKTRFGSFIRKFSIDELPQLVNVLKGEMSLIGPRPEIPCFVRQFKEEIPLYLVRQQVRPGMTGWAQVHGLRGDTSIEARVEYDIWYIENWSLALDIKILFRTLFGGVVNAERAL